MTKQYSKVHSQPPQPFHMPNTPPTRLYTLPIPTKPVLSLQSQSNPNQTNKKPIAMVQIATDNISYLHQSYKSLLVTQSNSLQSFYNIRYILVTERSIWKEFISNKTIIFAEKKTCNLEFDQLTTEKRNPWDLVMFLEDMDEYWLDIFMDYNRTVHLLEKRMENIEAKDSKLIFVRYKRALVWNWLFFEMLLAGNSGALSRVWSVLGALALVKLPRQSIQL